MKKLKENNFISAVIYINNNEKTINYFLNTIHNVFENNFENFEFIFVNDCCNDKTVELIKDFCKTKNLHCIRIINLSVFQGIEIAMNAGVDLAIGDFVFEFDSVLVDYEKEKIFQLYIKSLEGNDIVSACPETKVLFTSKIFYKIFNLFSKAKYNIRTERFRVLSRRAINRVGAISKTITYRKAVYANCGLKITHIMYEPLKTETKIDKSRFNHRKERALDSLILFTNIAYKISMTLTLGLLAFTTIAGIYTFTMYVSDFRPIEGWTTTMIVLTGGFSGVFLILAVIIKYLSILVELVLKKQSYMIESIEKL
ncbi:MAG: glycosyltransferase [Candidatus Muiribacteriota bacterium]